MRTNVRTWALRTLVLVLVLPAVTHGEESSGILWEADLHPGLVRAAAEGRPVLLAVNALETESANQRLARQIYPSPTWGRATRPWVAFVANPNIHGGSAICERYGQIPCTTHQEVLRYVIRRFARDGDLITPQHLILDPDGRLVYRKAFFTGVVGPALFESWLPRLSPSLAIDRAADLRADRIDALGRVDVEMVEEQARAWLQEDDPLAAGGVLSAADFADSEARQKALIRAFRALPTAFLPVPMVAAYEMAMDPDAGPEATEAWILTIRELDGPQGLELAARAAVRTKDERLRRRLLTLLFSPAGKAAPSRYRVSGTGWLDPEELLRAETYRALGRNLKVSKRPPPKAGATLPEGWARQVRLFGNAETLKGLAQQAGGVATSADVARLRRALLDASPEAVKKHAAFVRQIFRDREEERLRVAAAVALLGARLDEAGKVSLVVQEAVFDVVESIDTRPEAVRRLGKDPGYGEAAWLEALRAHLTEGN